MVLRNYSMRSGSRLGRRYVVNGGLGIGEQPLNVQPDWQAYRVLPTTPIWLGLVANTIYAQG